MADTRFRLRLKAVGDAGRTIVVPLADATVGCASGNDIVLPLAGVSRQHARLRTVGGCVEVRDLESKNGVHVNGARVAAATLVVGDEVRFGSVSLTLEAVDEHDLELALTLGDAQGPAPRAAEAASRVTDTWDASGAGEWLPLLERVAAVLGAAPDGLGAALAVLVEEGGLRGCAVADVRGRTAAVIGAAGTVAAVIDPQVVATIERSARDGALLSGTGTGDPQVSWAAFGGEPPRLLMAWADPGGRSVEPVLRVLVHLVSAASSGPRTAAAAVPSRRPLVFPTRHVRGAAPAMAELYARLETVADTTLPVLVVGETGVGKEDFARALHLSSSRCRGPFVAVNCAAIPAELLEAELFGVGRGAATGVAPRAGRFQLAHGGTLFLDEIGDMPLPLQAKLLRVVETGEVEPLAAATVVVDIRIVSATHVDLAARATAGLFRADLYYRLCGAELTIPPLRRRRQDIASLVDGFLRPLASASAKPIRGMTVKALAALVDYAWPGNVRELEHEVQRLFYACPAGEAIDFGMLPEAIRTARPAAGAVAVEDDSLDLQRHVDALEDRLIGEALRRTGGNRTEAAKLLGISRNGLALKMTRLGLARDEAS